VSGPSKSWPCKPGFITGSHAYGKPNEQSDIDLVLYLDPGTTELLIQMSDTKSIPVRYGNLNLILCRTDEEYTSWEITTSNLVQLSRKENRPIGHDEAKQAFDPFLKRMYGDFPVSVLRSLEDIPF